MKKWIKKNKTDLTLPALPIRTAMKTSHDLLSTAIEIREQLASESRRLLFFFGAGTSMAVGLPGVIALTKQIAEALQEPQKEQFGKLQKELPKNANVETILDRLRTLRQLIGDDHAKKYDGLKRADAEKLDAAICQAISEAVRKPAPKGMVPHQTFSQWLRALHSRREWPVEIFTTNYDLFFEQTMEHFGVPYFDGFVGSVEAFFAPESVEADGAKYDEIAYPPRAWTRLWKLHGSVNWRFQQDTKTSRSRIFRAASSECKAGEELAIFPSRDKYSQSRKLPFLALQDRFRHSLLRGESLLVLLGYSFSDQHLNEIIFQGLRSNPHLAVIVLLFEDIEEVYSYGIEYRNLSIYGPKKACIGGITGSWSEPQKPKQEWPFWDGSDKKFFLGDFNQFAKYLETFIGFRPIVPLDSSETKAPTPEPKPGA
jgi:hypothetical protein